MDRVTTARVSARGQVVIPKRIREDLGIRPGGVIAFEERDGRIVIRVVECSVTDPFGLFEEWAGEADERAYADL